MWEAWGETNNALGRRAAEMLEAKGQVQSHLYKVNFQYLNEVNI